MKKCNVSWRKPLLLLAVFALLSSNVHAQEETTFVVEGKTWTCEWLYGDEVYKIMGDTIVGGQTYKKMYHNGKFEYGVRQEGKKVYQILGEKNEQLVYDFGMNKGDIFTYEEQMKLRVVHVDTVNVDGIDYRRLEMCNIYFDANGEEINCDDEDAVTQIWVEGIGVDSDMPIDPWLGWVTKTRGSLKECLYNGKCIFTAQDFVKNLTDGVEHVTMKKGTDNNASIYDLTGRKLKETPARGVYIQGGKKRIVK